MKLMIVDLETGGLDETVHSLLEIGAFYVDFSREEYVMSEFHCLIRPNPLSICPYCYEMHTKNGLLDECMSRGEPAEVAKKRLKAWFWQQTHGASFNLCGFNPAFEAKWLKDFTKKVFWNCRLIDPRVYLVRSGDSELPTAEMCMARIEPDEPYEETHRAVPDCITTIKTARYWLSGISKSGK